MDKSLLEDDQVIEAIARAYAYLLALIEQEDQEKNTPVTPCLEQIT